MLKGLDCAAEEIDIILKEIKTDLENKHNLIVKNIFKLRTNGRTLYVVQTNNTVHLKYLINNVRYVCHTKISWERYTKQDPWTQCRRCQRLGHSTSNCRASPKCVKCGDDHWSRECKKVTKDDKESHVNIKCANCDGKHLAFSKDCPTIQRRHQIVQQLQAAREERTAMNRRPTHSKANYVMAPPPTVNAWTQRATLSERMQTPHTPFVAVSGNKNIQNNITDLVSEFNILDQLVDLNKMLLLVRELNTLLRDCKDELEKFVTLNNFCLKNFLANKPNQQASP